jgi:D-aminoacyl-tRNA deacylase
MIAVIQRVSLASVAIDGDVISSINKGLLILLGVAIDDTDDDLLWLAKKVAELRIFEDDEGKMNLSLMEIDGEALVVSQFTLLADYKKGRRPGFSKAATPEKAIPMYEKFMEELAKTGIAVKRGKFGADMKVSLLNDGPVTIVMDSSVKFPR